MDSQHAGGPTAGPFPHRCRPSRYGIPHFPHLKYPRLEYALLALVLVLLLIVAAAVLEGAAEVPVLAAGELFLALLTAPLLTARQMAGSLGSLPVLARRHCLRGWRHGTA